MGFFIIDTVDLWHLLLFSISSFLNRTPPSGQSWSSAPMHKQPFRILHSSIRPPPSSPMVASNQWGSWRKRKKGRGDKNQKRNKTILVCLVLFTYIPYPVGILYYIYIYMYACTCMHMHTWRRSSKSKKVLQVCIPATCTVWMYAYLWTFGTYIHV